MVWTKITRPQYRREGMRYESDTTDGEWLVMEPLLPPPSALGRPRETEMRALVNAILYIASTGCQWRQLPKDFPPYSRQIKHSCHPGDHRNDVDCLDPSISIHVRS